MVLIAASRSTGPGIYDIMVFHPQQLSSKTKNSLCHEEMSKVEFKEKSQL